MINKSLIVFGTGQQSEIISFYLKRQSRKVKFYCVDDKYFKKNKFQGINVISTSELLKKFKPQNYNLHIAISYSELNSLRSSKYNFFKKKGYKFENVTHNTNLSKIDLIIGENVVILDSFIQPKSKIGDNTFIWSGSIIGHHSDIGKHCWISSGVAIGGNCKIRDHTFFGMNVAVVGAANSAVDVALELYRKGAKSVTMIIREEEIGQNVKYWARPDINNRIKEGSIKAYFKTEVKEITNDKIIIETPKKKINIKNDFVLAMTGYKPNFELLESLGVEFEEDDYSTPVYDSKTMQSNQKGVFLAGVVCGGLKTNKWFIENSRDHAKIIMKNIKKTQ